jgi:hypothetical protein
MPKANIRNIYLGVTYRTVGENVWYKENNNSWKYFSKGVY